MGPGNDPRNPKHQQIEKSAQPESDKQTLLKNRLIDSRAEIMRWEDAGTELRSVDATSMSPEEVVDIELQITEIELTLQKLRQEYQTDLIRYHTEG